MTPGRLNSLYVDVMNIFLEYETRDDVGDVNSLS